MNNVPSSLASSLAASASPPAAAAAPPAGAAAAGPPEPTFSRSSLTSLPSSACLHVRTTVASRIPGSCAQRTLANSDVQMGSTSAILAAEIRVWSLSACDAISSGRADGRTRAATDGDLNAVIREDESGVGRGKLGGRHCYVLVFWRGECRGSGVVVAVEVSDTIFLGRVLSSMCVRAGARRKCCSS